MAKQEIKKSTPQPDNSSRSVELIELEQELTTINPQIFQGCYSKEKRRNLKKRFCNYDTGTFSFWSFT